MQRKQEKICYLVCAGESVPLGFSPAEEDFVIAVDGGAKYLEKSGIRTDLYLGDFDSLGFTPQSSNVIKLKAEKDETDTEAAAKEGLSRGYRSFRIYCVLGGRISHTLANLNTLLYLSRRGVNAKIIGKNSELFFLRDRAEFAEGGYLSLLPFCGNANVVIRNCKYSGNIHLTSEDGLGVSNEPLKGANVEIVSGEVLAIIER